MPPVPRIVIGDPAPGSPMGDSPLSLPERPVAIALAAVAGALSFLPLGLATLRPVFGALGIAKVAVALVLCGALLGSSLRIGDPALRVRRLAIGGALGFAVGLLAALALRELIPNRMIGGLAAIGAAGLVGVAGIGIAAVGSRRAGPFVVAGALASTSAFFTYALVWPTIYSPARWGSARFVTERLGGACLVGAFLAVGMAVAYLLARRVDPDA